MGRHGGGAHGTSASASNHVGVNTSTCSRPKPTSGEVDKTRHPPRCARRTVSGRLIKAKRDVLVVVVFRVAVDAVRVLLAEHPPVDFPVLHEALIASQEFAEEVFGVVPVSGVGYRAGPLDGLPAGSGGT